jgi:DNA-binding MarR family transcriptional regulator
VSTGSIGTGPHAGGWSVRAVGLTQFAVQSGMSELFAEVAPRHPELRPAHLQLARWGPMDGVRVTELAARAGMAKQSMHELVRHLERHGYLRREPDPADPRAQRIRLTGRGQDLQDQLRAASARVHLHWLDRLGADRFEALWTALNDLTGRADPLPDPAELRRETVRHPLEP